MSSSSSIAMLMVEGMVLNMLSSVIATMEAMKRCYAFVKPKYLFIGTTDASGKVHISSGVIDGVLSHQVNDVCTRSPTPACEQCVD